MIRQVLVGATTAAVAAAATPVPTWHSLPLPAHDIPKNIDPPLQHGRHDVHGWLWLPIDDGANASVAAQPVSELRGYFYHHTPEFWSDSPHNFEIMISATLKLDHGVAGLPLPPTDSVLNTEYVFTPPAFSLDELITGSASSFYGHFTNGSFDTPQYYILSNGTMTVDDVTTAHYLWDDSRLPVPDMLQQAYISYPRAVTPGARVAETSRSSNAVAHLYWLHILQRAPDYDQIVHVTLDTLTCEWRHGDTAEDALGSGANFGTDFQNDVLHRLPTGNHTVQLLTDASRNFTDKTTCQVTVVEEVHCVIMPDSFAKCPPR